MNIPLPGGRTLQIEFNFSVRVLPEPVYYLFVLTPITGVYTKQASSKDFQYLAAEAKRILQEWYGQTDEWGYENGRQWTHPKSPQAQKPGMARVDAFITTMDR